MARELAKTHRVFYVNHPYSIKDALKGWREGDPVLRSRLPGMLLGRTQFEHLDTIPDNFVAVQPPLTLPINWLPNGWVYRILQKINNQIVFRAIRKAIRHFEVQKYLYLNCYDPFFAGVLPKDFGATLCFYHCIDDITQDPYTVRHGKRLEDEAIRQADVTLVTSTNLYRLKSGMAQRCVKYFNAANVSVFERVLHETWPRPDILQGRSGKVIGFIGNLDPLRIDVGLLKKAALAYPDCTLLLVGPVNTPEITEIGLDKLPNVVLAGSRRLDDLPPLLQHMDCVLIPFRYNTLTASIYPLKINEYLAAGKPVVSSAFSEDIRGFAPYIYLSENDDAFIAQIGEALKENAPERRAERHAVAHTNTWAARIKQLWDVVEGREG